jgi:WG containing repeat
MKYLWLKAFVLFVFCITLIGCSQKSTPSPSAGLSADSTPILLPVKVSDKWGYANGNGQLVINPQFDAVEDFYEGRARVCLGKNCDLWNLSTTEGTDYLWGFIDTAGKVVITPQYKYETYFHEGLAAVCTGDCSSNPTKPHSHGYIDPDGKVVISIQFGDALAFTESLAAVCVGICDYESKDSSWNGKWGFIDHAGHFVVNPQYDDANAFKNGFAKVTAGKGKDAKFGYIDKTGKTIWQPSN